MKFRYILSSLVAAAAIVAGCAEETLTLDEVQVSKSVISIPVDGGQTEITVNATGDWTINGVPEWLTVTPASGASGETKVTFSAGATEDANTVDLSLVCEGATQVLKIIQGVSSSDKIVTCKEVIDGKDGKTYRIKGTVSKIAANVYGNYYVTDATGTVYIYGTLDANGAEKNFASWGLEEGDIITVQGPKTTYNSTIELVNVTVIAIEKSLIKVESVDPEDATIEKEGGEYTVTLTNKGESFDVVVPESVKSWVSIASVSTSGTSAVVKFNIAENPEGDRTAEFLYTTTKTDDKGVKTTYTATSALTQKGAIIETTIDKFIAAEVGNVVYRLTGCVTNVADASKGNFTITDGTGSTYVYKCSGAADLKEGDIVTLTGKRGAYNGNHQVTSGTVETVNAVAEITVADFLAKSQDKNTYFKLTGKVTQPTDEEKAANCKFDLTDYGNFVLEDATGRVYVYGVLNGWGGKKGNGTFATLSVKENDTITIVGYRTAYKTLDQVGGAFYFSHVAAE